MSIRIDLGIKTEIDVDFLSEGISLRLIRLITTVQVQAATGWSEAQEAIVDTGNPVSLIPRSVWKEGEIKWLLTREATLQGIGGGGIRGRLGEVTLVFSDRVRVSPPMRLKAHLIDDDSVPFLIGFEDVLTNVRLVSDYAAKKAYLEWSSYP